MSKQVIRLTESDLHNIINQNIKEYFHRNVNENKKQNTNSALNGLNNIIKSHINECLKEIKFGGESFHGTDSDDWDSMAKIRSHVHNKKGVDKDKNWKNFTKDLKNVKRSERYPSNKSIDKANNAMDNLNLESVIKKHINRALDEAKFRRQSFHGHYAGAPDQLKTAEDFSTLAHARDIYTDEHGWDEDNSINAYIDDGNNILVVTIFIKKTWLSHIIFIYMHYKAKKSIKTHLHEKGIQI